MKVKVGPYPSRLTCNIYRNYKQGKDGYNWKENTRFEKFLDKLEDAIQAVYNVINRAYFDEKTQKVSVKIDRWDTWSMDHTLAHIVVPMLKQLKETKHGAPYVYPEDVPSELRPSKKELTAFSTKGATDSNWFKRWDYVLDEMIWAFEQKALDNWEEQYYGEWIEDETKMFGGYHINADDEGREAHQKRMSNGFKLFGKYYEALWD